MRGIKRSCAFLMALCIIFTGCGKKAESKSETSETSETTTVSEIETTTSETSAKTEGSASYADKLFTTDKVHTINIELSDEDWADLKENPKSKTKYEANITIDGETLENVSFATKGNTSLSSVADDEDSDRYSFKVNFGKFTDGQTYYGLDKLYLNNIYADATYMKDYLSYRIFSEAGIESPLVSYVSLTVNGENAGLYIAIEEISESYLARTANGEGELYKPETEQLDNINGGDMKLPDNMQQPPEGFDGSEAPESPSGQQGDNSDSTSSEDDRRGMTPPNGGDMPEKPDGEQFDGDMPQMPDGQQFDGEMPQMPDGAEPPQGGGFGSADNGASLKYTDDDKESYSDIFDNAITDPDDSAEERVIAALKKLSEGDTEGALDTDSVIRYFAAHNFVMNYDSYTGNMLHNYYLYENSGKLSMLPWDYNLAFGAFMNQGGKSDDSSAFDSTTIVNYGIDTPLFGAENSDRPMWSWIAENDEYLEEYHEVFGELLENYFESGEFETEIEQLYNMILPYVEQDATAFYSADEFKTAYSTLKSFCLERAESIRLQLDGKLSADSSEQNDGDKVDASDINIDDMGTQNFRDMKQPEFLTSDSADENQ